MYTKVPTEIDVNVYTSLFINKLSLALCQRHLTRTFCFDNSIVSVDSRDFPFPGRRLSTDCLDGAELVKNVIRLECTSSAIWWLKVT